MPPINFLVKPASSFCNLKCGYCFYRDEAENRETAAYGIMNGDTLEAVIAKGLAYADQLCGFAFQGGEPTLAGLDFFKEAVALQKKHNVKKVKIINSLQTNGMVINDGWAQFLHDNSFLVGLSLDGPKEIHDLHRKDSRNHSSFSRVMKTAGLFDRFGVDYNILSVVTANSSRFADRIYDFYKRNGFRYLQFIPCLAPLGADPGHFAYALKPAELERFLKRLFDRWYDDFTRGEYISIRYFDNLVYMINGAPPEACSMAGICQCNCVVESDGGVYPCDFYALDRWRLGNIKENSIEELLAGKTAGEFVALSKAVGSACRSCRWLTLCRGGCRRDCEPLQEGEERNNYFCAAYQGFFDYAYERLALVARSVQGTR